MHRTSSKNRSLKVQRETVRMLASSELRSAQGGTVLVSVGTPYKCPVLVDIPDFGGGGGSLSRELPTRCPATEPGRGGLIIDPLPVLPAPIRGGGY